MIFSEHEKSGLVMRYFIYNTTMQDPLPLPLILGDHPAGWIISAETNLRFVIDAGISDQELSIK